MYAHAGIGEYWVIDLNSDTVIRHLEPADGIYHHLTPVAPDAPFAPVRLADLTLTPTDVFGPRR